MADIHGLQLQEFAGKVDKAPSIDKQATYDEDGLVIRPGWIAKFSGVVDETDLQRRLSEKAMATMRWSGDPPPARETRVGTGNRKFLRKMGSDR